MVGRLEMWLQAPDCEIDASAFSFLVRAGYAPAATSAGDT
jgi:hypothetical protein